MARPLFQNAVTSIKNINKNYSQNYFFEFFSGGEAAGKKLMRHFDIVTKRIDWECIKAVLIAFIITRLMVLLISYFSMAQIPVLSNDSIWRYYPKNIILDGLVRWDSGWYYLIAQNGYTSRESTAFFPLYPFLIQLITSFRGSIGANGLWISNASFFIALLYFYQITKKEFDDDTAGRAVFYIASAPAAYVFSAMYTESIFMLFLAASFYYARSGKWFLAAIAGSLASVTRLTGILAAVFILFEALWQQGVRFIPKPWNLKSQMEILTGDIRIIPKAWKGILASILSISGLIGYMVFLHQKFGDPIAFLHAEQHWDKAISWNWFSTLIQYIFDTHQITGPILSGGIANIEYLMDTFAIIIFLPLVIIVFLKFRPSFGLFTVLCFLLPLTGGTATSMRRYVLALLPCYILLALWGKRTWVDRLIIGISLPLQAYFLILFTHWYWAG